LRFESEEEAEYPLRWYALAVLCLALFIGQVDVTIVNIALPSIAADLDATTSDLQWVIAAYSVVLAGFVLVGGGLADRYGRKGLFMTGLALFGSASIVAVFATEPWHLIATRAVMGLGAAFFFPPALSLLAVIFQSDERGRAVSIWAATGGVATVLGPILGGLLLERFWWGAVFLVNVPVTAIGIVGAAFLIPRSRRAGAPRLDRVGALLSVIGLTAFVFGVIEAPSRGWGSPLIVAALVIGTLGVIAFVLWELRRDQPMVDVRVFRLGGVAGGGLALTMNLLAMVAVLFLLPLYLQSVRGESAIAVGLALVPFGLTFMVLAFTAGAAVKRHGVRPILTGGLLLMSLGMVLLSFAVDTDGLGIVLVATMVFGAGAAFVAPPGTTAILNALPTEKAGDGSAVNQITRQVGAAFGVAIAGAVLASIYASDLAPSLSSLSSADAATAEASINGAQQVASSLSSGSEQLIAAADSAFSSGYRIAMLVPAVMVALTAVVVFFIVPKEDTEGPGGSARGDGSGRGDSAAGRGAEARATSGVAHDDSRRAGSRAVT
jgi:EmrB/QacA subfamily drug resistance transporter